MRITTVFLLSAAAVYVICTSVIANAAEPGSSQPDTSAVDWTGASIGIVGGISALDGTTRIPAYSRDAFHADSTSGAIGAKAGYNQHFANDIVLGIEASMFALFNEGHSTFGNEDWHVNADWQGVMVGRIGYASGRFLPYLKGGVSFLHLKDLRYESSIFPSSRPLDRSYVGWTVGAGVDYAVDNNWVLGVDYAYSDFGSHNFENDEIGPTFVEPGLHLISASISYKF